MDQVISDVFLYNGRGGGQERRLWRLEATTRIALWDGALIPRLSSFMKTAVKRKTFHF